MPVYLLDLKKRRQGSKRSKKIAERNHAKRRFLGRYGLVLSKPLRKMIIESIQTGKGTLVEKQSKRVSLWKNVVPGLPDAVVVYDKERKEIVTVL